MANYKNVIQKNYSYDPNTRHLNTRNICIPKLKKEKNTLTISLFKPKKCLHTGHHSKWNHLTIQLSFGSLFSLFEYRSSLVFGSLLKVEIKLKHFVFSG